MFKLRDREITEKVIEKLKDFDQNIIIMHVCGGHQDTLVRFGLDRMLADVGVDIRQGPGCPVCVTPPKEIEQVMLLAEKGKTITVFGDMMRVPGEKKTLFDIRSEGGSVRMVYSVDDAIEYARENPDKDVVFMGIGFETTAPSTACALLSNPPENFSVLSTHRYVPPALKALVELGEVRLQGLIEPGHVTAIIGLEPYRFLSKKHGVPQVVAGFEPVDLMMSVFMVARQIKEGRAELENEYARVVKPDGNEKAKEMLAEAFVPKDAAWRGLGVIPESGMVIRKTYESHDAEKVHEDILKELDGKVFREPAGCRCGEVLRGVFMPNECPLFGKTCTPKTPVGPCMVTSEGACSILFKYGSK